VEKCQVRSAVAQKNHILFSLRAFIRLEVKCWETGKSWYETKQEIIRDAVKRFCRMPDLLQTTSA
jgi:putative transposase